MKLSIYLLIFIFSIPVYGQQKQLSAKQKETDFLFLYQALSNNYPYFGVSKRLTGIDWLSKKDEYIHRLVKTRTDDAWLSELESILNELGCNHTDISPTRHWDKFREVYGKISQYNPGYEHWVNILNQSAGKVSYWNQLLLANNYTAANYTKPMHIAQTANYQDSITPNGRIGIMRITSFEVKHLEDDFYRITNFLNRLDEADFLIIDLQSNKGGTTQYWMKSIVSRLIQFPVDFHRNLTMKNGSINHHFYPYYHINGQILQQQPDLSHIPIEYLDGSYLYLKESTLIYPFEPVRFRGSIILLIDGKTSSAADEFAVFCKSTGWATVTGQTSAGGGIGGDPALLQLPESGVIIRYPALTGFNPDGSVNMETRTIPNMQIDGRNADERLGNVIRLLQQFPLIINNHKNNSVIR